MLPSAAFSTVPDHGSVYISSPPPTPPRDSDSDEEWLPNARSRPGSWAHSSRLGQRATKRRVRSSVTGKPIKRSKNQSVFAKAGREHPSSACEVADVSHAVVASPTSSPTFPKLHVSPPVLSTEDEPECVVCYNRSSSTVMCSAGHQTCATCLVHLTKESIRRPLFEVSAEEKERSRYNVTCHSTTFCKKPFSFQDTIATVDSATADMLDMANKQLFHDQRREAERKEEEERKELEEERKKKAEEEESIRQAHTRGDGTFLGYMCANPNCLYGPVMHCYCNDLHAHHGQVVGNASINNSCPRCKTVPNHSNSELAIFWIPWDGTVRLYVDESAHVDESVHIEAETDKDANVDAEHVPVVIDVEAEHLNNIRNRLTMMGFPLQNVNTVLVLTGADENLAVSRLLQMP